MENKKLKVALMDRYINGKDFTEGDNFIEYARRFLDRGCNVSQLDPYKIDFSENQGIYYPIIPVNGKQIHTKAPMLDDLNKFDIIMDLSDIVNEDFAENLVKVNSLHINNPISTYESADKRTYLDKYKEFIPKSFVSSDLNELERILKNEFNGKMVAKDPFGCCGRGVELITKDNIEILKDMIDNGKNEIVAQKFINIAYEGSKRVAVFGNPENPDSYKILHFYGRKPVQGEWKDNLAQGGEVIEFDKIRNDEKELCLNVAKKSGLYLMGLDIMDDLNEKGERVSKLVETNSVLALAKGKGGEKLKIAVDFILDDVMKRK